MNAFDIEILRQTLLVNIPLTYGKSKVFLFHNFYSSLLNSSDDSLIEAFSLEFIEEYINLIKHYSPFCLPPQRTHDLINQLKEIADQISMSNFQEAILKEIERLKPQLDELNSILYGNQKIEQKLNRLSFPLLEDGNINHEDVYGFLETVRITINKNRYENKLYVFPNTGELEKNLEKQIRDSFSLAIGYLSNYAKKFAVYHEIIVYFDNYSANYIGNSLGIALTIGFIKQLSKLYNLPYLVNIKNNIASTGGISTKGEILVVKKEFIEKKVEVVFYSPIEIFIVPKDDEQYAIEKLNEFKQLYPQRNLKIIGVTDLEDILDRRNLISISKQNLIVRSAKASVRNWRVSLLVVILYLIISISLYRNFDENPAAFENQGETLFIKNKSGRILWTKKINYDSSRINSESQLQTIQKIIDIDDDGTNEVIVTMESSDEMENPNDYGRIACFDSEGKLIWSYCHKDSISITEDLPHQNYITNLIDTFGINGNKYLIALASKNSIRNSVLFGLNIKTGQKENHVLLHNGLIKNAFIYDFNKDGIQEVIFTAFNNQFMKAAVGVIDIDFVSVNNIKNKSCSIDTIPNADMNFYVVLPQINYDKQTNSLTDYSKLNGLINNPTENCIYLSCAETENSEPIFTFKFNYSWQKIDMIIEPGFNTERDSLLKREMLKYHINNKSEFMQYLINDALYWNGKEFIKKPD